MVEVCNTYSSVSHLGCDQLDQHLIWLYERFIMSVAESQRTTSCSSSVTAALTGCLYILWPASSTMAASESPPPPCLEDQQTRPPKSPSLARSPQCLKRQLSSSSTSTMTSSTPTAKPRAPWPPR